MPKAAAPSVAKGTQEFISNYLRECDYAATGYVVYFPEEAVAALRKARGFDLRIKASHGDAKLLSAKNTVYTRRRDDDGERIYRTVTGSFVLAPLPTPQAHILISRDSSSYIHDGLKRLIYNSRLSGCRMRLTSDELRAVVQGLLKRRPGRLVVSRAIGRNVREESVISHERHSVDEVFEDAAEQGRRVHSLSFTLRDPETADVLLKASISRDGRVSYRSGAVSLFLGGLVDGAAGTVRERKDKLQGRERKRGTDEVKPLSLKFSRSVFSEQSDVLSFLQVIASIQHGEYTIYHRNPYLHIGFFDFFDSSEFDVFIDGPDSAMLIPQYRATVPSLFRFCQKVFEHFEEGTILRLEEVQ